MWYRLSDAAEWRTMRMLSNNIMEATVTNLESGREYEFMVLSQDRYGDGMFSKTFKYYTKRTYQNYFAFLQRHIYNFLT